MNCGEIRQKIYLFYYGELSASELKDIYEHLSNCNHCDKERRIIAQILEVLQNGFKDEEPPMGLKEKIFNNLE